MSTKPLARRYRTERQATWIVATSNSLMMMQIMIHATMVITNSSMMKLKFKSALCLVTCVLMLQLTEPFNYSRLKNVVFERPYQERKNITLVARPSTTSRIQQNVEDYRQKEVWDMINIMDSFKTNRVYTQ